MALKEAFKNPASISAKNILKLGKAPYHFVGSLLHATKMKQYAGQT
jgi:hypothetical protein